MLTTIVIIGLWFGAGAANIHCNLQDDKSECLVDRSYED